MAVGGATAWCISRRPARPSGTYRARRDAERDTRHSPALPLGELGRGGGCPLGQGSLVTALARVDHVSLRSGGRVRVVHPQSRPPPASAAGPAAPVVIGTPVQRGRLRRA